MFRRCALVLSVASLLLFAGSTRADVLNMGGTRDPTTGTWTGEASLEFVPVGDAGNMADTVMMNDGTTGYGSVPYVYQMGKYDVTVGQYTAFLNAVAATDTYGLYNSKMATDFSTIKIIQSGTAGNYSYSVTGSYSQAANCPIFDVSWGDAARFCNWLQNGQPTTLGEGAGSTETGAYTLNGATTQSTLIAIIRNAGATYVIPTEDEWYKAAYYKGGGTNVGYWTYPTKSNTAPGNTLPDAGNDANFCNPGFTDPTNYLTPVGAFAASPGPHGTYDMGGDVWQWNETAVASSSRGLRGGDWYGDYNYRDLAASTRYNGSPTTEYHDVGFRMASVPEPGSIALVIAGGLCLLAYAWRRRSV